MPPLTEEQRTGRPGGEAPRFDFFFYGTLCDSEIRALVLGRKIAVEPATLADHEAVPVDRGRFPILLFRRGAAAPGVLCRGVGLAESARLGFYENEGRDFGVRRLEVRLGDGAIHPAWVFLPTAALRRGMGRWDLGEWQRFAKRQYLTRVARTMRALEPAQLEPFVEIWRRRGEERAGAGARP